VTRDLNLNGVYCVCFWTGGEYQAILVDSQLPYQGYSPKYMRSADHSLWPMIIEKAFAKLHGSYDNLDGGSPDDAF